MSIFTGDFSGTCVLLEQKLGRSLLSLACRHHIFETLIGAVFSLKIGPSRGPLVPLFARFQKSWKDIDKSKYDAGINNKDIRCAVKDIGDDIKVFCKNELKKDIIRHVYQELLQLTLVFLGAGTSESISFRAPCAMHHARWMARAVYSLKIYLFRTQFKLKPREEKSLQEINIYIIRFLTGLVYL